MSKEVRKNNKILKRLKTRCLFLENCVVPWKHLIVINVFFYQRTSEERLHDIIQDSKDVELKTAFRECPSPLEVFERPLN